ncbi:MAG: SDR family NAD(P)-dependent oxidoreductase [Solirubrobacterales bacterium]
MELDGKVALVTGASAGIGAQVSRRLHDAGASVGMLSRRGEDLGLERALGLACDVRDREAVSASVSETVERFGRLDVVIANAGVGAYGNFLDLDPEQIEEMIDVNLKGTLYTAAAALPHLIEAGEGTSSRWRASRACAPSPASPSTTPRSSASSASPAPSTTSCARRA